VIAGTAVDDPHAAEGQKQTVPRCS
jgi:hypothetical protein